MNNIIRNCYLYIKFKYKTYFIKKNRLVLIIIFHYRRIKRALFNIC
jgi:hypothetical protein